jgi:hypothetical protein
MSVLGHTLSHVSLRARTLNLIQVKKELCNRIALPCPLWVKSGHGALKMRCPLYPQSGHCRATVRCPLSARLGLSAMQQKER